MTDLYAVLGVARDATRDELHVAFRRKAKEHHPDTGGDETSFRAVAQAFAILRDATKRAAYDRDGTISFAADNSHADALRIVQAEIEGLLGTMQNHGPEGVLRSNVIEIITSVIDQKIANIEKIADRIRQDIVRLSDFAERFTTEDGGPNVLRKMVEAKIRNLEEAIPKAEADLVAHRGARQVVSEHQFRRDDTIAQFITSNSVFGAMTGQPF